MTGTSPASIGSGSCQCPITEMPSSVNNPAEIRLSSGDRVLIEAVSGAVADDRRTADTQFYSVGGGGYVGPHGGSVEAPQIRSVTDNHQTIWITDDRGKDHSLKLTNVSIPLRVGQRVTAYYCHFEGSNWNRCEYLCNHSAQLVYNLARRFGPLVNFESRYRKGALLRLLQGLAFVGAVLSALLYFYWDHQDAEALSRHWAMPVCQPLGPRDARKPQGARDEIERRFEICRANIAKEMVVKRNLQLLSLLPFYCAGFWLLLGYVSWVEKIAYGRRLHAEYLAALDRELKG